MRKHLAATGIGGSATFRWRGSEVTRVEGFSDAVFAFAVTLLVVSLEVPRTFDQLLATMRNFGAFAICFFLLLNVWYNHYIFFRRYGLQDLGALTLNGILLFVVLFYVYPLKFLFTLFTAQIMGIETGETLPSGGFEPAIKPGQFSTLMVIYGLGYVAVFTVFALLYGHAYRQRLALDLNDLEVFDTRNSIQQHVIHISIGLLSLGIALASSMGTSAWAGWVYFLLGPALALNGTSMGRRRRKLAQQHTLVVPPRTTNTAAN